MDSVEIMPVKRGFRGRVRVPGSKSITNRALPLAALCEGETELRGVLFADDTRRMIEALAAVGYELKIDEAGANHQNKRGADESCLRGKVQRSSVEIPEQQFDF